MSAEQSSTIESTLRRIDDLVGALSHIADPAGRESARALLEAVLDLHGLALARVMAVAAAEGGSALVDRLAQDEQVRPVLLLYGLHPDDARTRVHKALDALRPELCAAGIGVEVTRITATAASLRMSGGQAQADALRRQIEEAIVNAAPDLDQVVVEWTEATDSVDAPALAG